MSYEIRRFYQNESFEVVKNGLTLEEAKEHCHDPETSSRTCKKPHNVARTETRGPWFDGYTEV